MSGKRVRSSLSELMLKMESVWIFMSGSAPKRDSERSKSRSRRLVLTVSSRVAKVSCVRLENCGAEEPALCLTEDFERGFSETFGLVDFG